MDHDLAADQPVAIAGEVALAADEMVLVDPFPRARLEMSAHPIAIHQVHDQGAARAERPLDRFENREIVLRPLEIAKGIAEHAHAAKFGVAEAKAAGVALVERDRQAALAGALAGEPDQIAGAVEPGNADKAAGGEFERVASLAAAQIENALVALDAGAVDQQIDLLRGVAVVLDHIAIGFEIERVEQGAPPIGWQMTFEIGHRAQGAGADPSPLVASPLVASLLGSLRLRPGWPGTGGPRTTDLPAHTPTPEPSSSVNLRASKRRLPDQGNRREAASAGAAANFDRSRPAALAGPSRASLAVGAPPLVSARIKGGLLLIIGSAVPTMRVARSSE